MPYVGVLDESNLSPGDFVRFYVTAVMACPAENLALLSQRVAEIRKRHGYRAGDFFKWESHSRPEHVSQKDHLDAKAETLEILRPHRLVFLPVLVPHHVAERNPSKTLVDWNANMAILLWERFLESIHDTGVCILDRRPGGDDGSYLRELFSREAESSLGRDFSLKRTHVLGYTMEGASHLLSVLDIALGAFCYAINDRRQQQSQMASKMLKSVVGAMRQSVIPGGQTVLETEGYAFLPLKKKTPRVRTEYDELIEHWNRLLARQPE